MLFYKREMILQLTPESIGCITQKFLVLALLGLCTIIAPYMDCGASEANVHQNGLPSDSSYFPLGVWMQPPRLAPEYKAIGVNLFVGLWRGPTEAQLAELAKYDMPVLAEQNDVGLTSRNSRMIRGWLLHEDEPDNAQPSASGGRGPCMSAKDVSKETRAIQSKDPTRPVLVGFGRGVADPNWRGRGFCTGDMAYYDVAAVGADILSFDIYPVASGYGRQLDYPSRGIERLRVIARERRHVWAVVETTQIGSPDSRVSPAELRSEILLALIRGADGLIYFVHEWTGGFREDALFRYPEIVSAVKDMNALLLRLAPVLNSPTIGGRVATSGTIASATMLKEHDGVQYLFAGSTEAKAGFLSISLSGVLDGSAEVIGENRRTPIKDGVFHDSFAGYEVHIYRIAKGVSP
jgi:hypothetical protein